MSADYSNDTRSSIVDAPSTMVTDDTLLKVYAWYDNEIGYVCRMVDLANIVIAAERVMATRRATTSIVTASYWGFTLVDGALRMLVLLHFFKLGYTPFTLAFLFLLYEAAGIVANLGGGWLASRFGIPRMLAVGQALQIAGLVMLSALDPGWSAAAVGRLGGRRARHRRPRQGLHQDRVQVGDQGDVRRRQRPAVQMGRVVHRLEERHEGRRLLRRRLAARGRSASGPRSG